MEDKLEILQENLSSQYWRLNHLYKIKNKEGKVVTFVMNGAQEELYENQWYLTNILKARQLGFSTLIDLLILDACLFNSNIECGIIAQDRNAANAIFANKIKFPYDNLPQIIREKVSSRTDRVGEISFSNGSSIRVGTTFRSGTLQILHVSEFGKIAMNSPTKAEEIVTGAFEAVGSGQQIFVESTAEGRSGAFYDLCKTSKDMYDQKVKLSEMDFAFRFFPWHQNPDYKLDPSMVVFTTDDLRYFKDLEEQGIRLREEQKAWWVKKHLRLQELMYREHPSYPEEAFKASIIGAYYGKTISTLRRKGRITDVPWDNSFPVYTSWDLGMNDDNPIWFFQVVGRAIHIIDYEAYGGKDETYGLDFYAKLIKEKPYTYYEHYLPHDVAVRESGIAMSRKQKLEQLGVFPVVKVDRPRNNDQLLDQIEMTRVFLARCWIDEAKCSEGIKSLENYRKIWDEKHQSFNDRPLHNWASHGADAMRTGAVGFRTPEVLGQNDLEPEPVPAY